MVKKVYGPVRPVIGLLLLFIFTQSCCGNYPLLDVDTNMRIVLVPHDAEVGTIIYRLRASDSDNNFPLTFEVLGSLGKTLLSLEFLGCSEVESLCQADVVLNKPLDLGRTYEFQLRVTDTSGDFTRVKAAITATEGTSFVQSMLGPKILRIPESMALGTQLASFVVIKNELNSRTVLLEMRESKSRIELKQRLLSNNRTEGTLYLKKFLDFETEPWFTFQLLAMNAHTNTSVDTRNVLVSEVIVAIEDVQDTRPQFTHIPSFVELSGTINPGTVVARVQAEDGDRENKRLIRYGFLTESNPFVAFFELDPMSGEIRLKRNMSELAAIAKPNEAIHMSIQAQEIIPSGSQRSLGDETTAVANISFWLGHRLTRHVPAFSLDRYIGEISENSVIGSAVTFPQANKVFLENSGENMELHFPTTGIGKLGFSVSPREGKGNITFDILVADSSLLDCETQKLIRLKLRATTTAGSSSEVDVEIHIRDENDNPPIFSEKEYHIEIHENAPVGTTILRLQATDKDSGHFGQIVYSSVAGSEAFRVEPLSGEIIVDKPSLLDRELQSEIRLYVEAKDGGLIDSSDSHYIRNIATATVVIKLLDKNDEVPTFEKNHYQAILTPELDALKWPLQVKAHDMDQEGLPNSQVRYQIIGDGHFTIDANSGDIRLRSPFRPNLNSESPFLGTFKVRASDLGAPPLVSEATVQIFSEDVMSQDVQFLFPSTPDIINKDKLKIEQMLASLTGGHVEIREISSYDSKAQPQPAFPPQNQKASRSSASWPQSRSLSNPNNNEAPGDAASTSSSDQSVVRATVYSPLNGRPRTVDFNGLKAFMSSENPTPTPSPSKEVEISKAESRGLFWVLITLIILLVLLFIIFLCCIFCPCCWLHRSNSARKSEKTIERSEIKEIERYPGRRRVAPIESGNIEYDTSYRAREAWSGDDNQWRRQVYPLGNRKPRNLQQNMQQRSGVGTEDWEFTEHGMPPQGPRGDMRSEEIVPRWQYVNQNQNTQQRRHVGYIGHPHPGDEGFVRRHADQDQFERDSNYARNNFGYLTGEMDNRGDRVQRHPAQRSPSRSLPPNTTEFRVQMEPKNPNTRFFRTEMGEVLQFDFDGDEGKEMLMRRFIDEQKPQASEREDQLLSGKESRVYGRRPDTPTQSYKTRRRIPDGQGLQSGNDLSSATLAAAYHIEQEGTSDRPKAASISRRQNLPRERQDIPFNREIPELEEEEIEEIPIPGAIRPAHKSRQMEAAHDSESSTGVGPVSVHRHRRKDKQDKTQRLKPTQHRSSSHGSNDSIPKSKSKSKTKSRSKSPLAVHARHKRSDSKSQSRSHSPPPKSVHSHQSKSKTKKTKEKSQESRPILTPVEQTELERGSNDLNAQRESSTSKGLLVDQHDSNIAIAVLSPSSVKSYNSHHNDENQKHKSEVINQNLSTIQVQNEGNGSIREEDDDSGIGLVGVANKRSKMLEKKSVFTIAYDDMASQNVLRPDTALNTDPEMQLRG